MWLPKDKDYRLIENIIVVEDREVYNHGGKLLGVLSNPQYPRSQAEIIALMKPAKAVEVKTEEKTEEVPSKFSLETFRRSPGRPKKDKAE